MKFYPHGIGSDRQALTFTKVKERIVLKVQKEFDHRKDIGESIREMKVIDLIPLRPTLQDLVETDPARKAREEKVLEAIYQEEMALFLKREVALENNLG